MRQPLLVLTIALAIAGCAKSPPTAVATTTLATMDNAELLARGEYLVRIGGCNDCHTAGYAQQQGNMTRRNG